jgi:hypothetical protein
VLNNVRNELLHLSDLSDTVVVSNFIDDVCAMCIILVLVTHDLLIQPESKLSPQESEALQSLLVEAEVEAR